MAVYLGKERYEVFFNRAAYLLRVPRIIYIELKKYVGIKLKRKSKMSKVQAEELSATNTFVNKNKVNFSHTEVEGSQISINSKFSTSVLARLNGYLKISPIYLSQIFTQTRKLCQTAAGLVLKSKRQIESNVKFLLIQAGTFIVRNTYSFGIKSSAVVSHANSNRLKGKDIQYTGSFQKAEVVGTASTASVERAKQGHYAKMAYWIEPIRDEDESLFTQQTYDAVQNRTVLEVK